ncbi:uncharacterized protein LOC126809891 [Patella vulgata]|uniref:uncharacterized protein LOC126809891 n=1 Tax=Patella vulgata TaxID=6465 RepID=UPI00217FD3CC|nr:uncharacterized protein LOC126809891 [Patella vulgata]
MVSLVYADFYEGELKRRLEKLSRVYDMATMKIFIAVEAVGENLMYNTYSKEKQHRWEFFITRREACRLDLDKHDRTREKYLYFLLHIPAEIQGQQFHSAMLSQLHSRGALDAFHYLTFTKEEDAAASFCGYLCRLFARKIETWFDSFEALAIQLTAHVKVSNMVRVLSGQIDALCRRKGKLHVMNIKSTGLSTPRPLDIAELCLAKCMAIQNGLASPNELRLTVLICHFTNDRPILRLWEYRPSEEMERAIREADIDKMIDAGKLTQYHEYWKGNVHRFTELVHVYV